MSNGKVVIDESELERLDNNVEELIELCERLRSENRALRGELSTLQQERSILTKRNEEARTKVESMIMRLRTLEQHQCQKSQ